MGHQLIQQATNRWRAVLTTEGTKICTPGCLLSSTLQLLKESVMSLVRTPLEKDCTEIYQKTKEILQHYKKKKSFTHNITKEEREAIKTLRKDASCVVLTADKGVALVVIDKSQYVDKCMALLDDTKVYKPCKDTTKKLHRDVQETLQQFNREHGSSRLYWWSKCHYNELLPTGNTSPAPRFYGLPKIHKANCPM